MTRTSIFILGLAAAITFPATASASCGTMQGSFIVTCEQGVQVYRHNALSGVPAPMTQAQADLKIEQSRAKTARQRISAQARTDARNANLRERELAIKDLEARTTAEALRRDPRAYSNAGYRYGVGRVSFHNRRRAPKSRYLNK